MLYALAFDNDSQRISFGEIAAGLRNRAFGLSMLVFALPCCLPMPPGIPTICGFAIALIAVHMLIGREQLWLPRALANRSIRRADLRRLVDRVLPYVGRLERFCRPRIEVTTERLGKAVIGLVVLALGVLLILPIPVLGNLPPGVSAAVIAIGVSERDGLVVLLGLVCAGVAMALTSAAAWAALQVLARLL